MNQPPATLPPDHRPAANQFSLRGMFIFMTAVSVILALLSLAIQQPYQWLGMLGIIAFCLLMVAVLEAGGRLFPRRPRNPYVIPQALPANPLQTAYFGDGEYPFAPQPAFGESPFAPTKPDVSEAEPDNLPSGPKPLSPPAD